MDKEFFTGSICLSEIPKDLIQWVVCKDGQRRAYLNICVVQRNEPKQFSNRTLTHFIKCSVPRDKQVEGVNYYLGDLTKHDSNTSSANPTQNNTQSDELPF